MGQLNQRNLTQIAFEDFSGGYAAAKGPTGLGANEAQDLKNIVLPPGGRSFRKRPGTQQVTPVGGSGQNIYSYTLGTYAFRLKAVGSDTAANNPLRVFTVTKLTAKSGGFDQVAFTSWNIDGTSSPAFTSYGVVYYTGDTVTSDFRYAIVPFQNYMICTSKQGGATSGLGAVPIKVAFTDLGGGNLSGLGGTPPVGDVAINWNNRMWIGNTTSNPSKLFYSILNSAEDWSSSGSGFVEPDPASADELMALAPVANNVLLYFKQKKIFQVVGRSDPFAVFPLFDGVGCVGKDACVTIDGMAYFITMGGQMRITDGSKLYTSADIPKLADADDLWARIPVNRRTFIRGARHRGKDFDHLVWLVTLDSGSTNNCAIIWDLTNKCWLKGLNGYIGNNITSNAEGRAFIGSYDSFRIFELGVEGTHVDDCNGTVTYNGSGRLIAPTSPTAVAWLWRSDDFKLKNIVQASEIGLMSILGGSGDVSLTYRYDGLADSTALTKTLSPTSTTLRKDTWRPLGRGVTFGVEFSGSSAVTYQILSYSLAGREQGHKDESKGIR
jgi:hypothetical protein